MITCSVTLCSAWFTFSLRLILFPFPLKMRSGLTLGSPSANKVIWALHCRLSKPDAPPRTHMVLSPLLAYVPPLANVKVRGVWSTLTICCRAKHPTGLVGRSSGAALLMFRETVGQPPSYHLRVSGTHLLLCVDWFYVWTWIHQTKSQRTWNWNLGSSPWEAV